MYFHRGYLAYLRRKRYLVEVALCTEDRRQGHYECLSMAHRAVVVWKWSAHPSVCLDASDYPASSSSLSLW